MRRIAVAVACATLACAGGRAAQKPITVSDSDYGRLQPGQTAIVDAARADLARARDEAARAKLRQTDVRNQDELAKADLSAAASEKTRAEALGKAANESRDPAQLASAKAMADSAALRRKTAEAHAEYAKQLQAARAAEVDAAERRIAYESARVELAKLQALQAAGVPAATKYDAGRLQAAVDQARRDLEAAEAKVRSGEPGVAARQRSWEELNRQLAASAGAATPHAAPPAGTPPQTAPSSTMPSSTAPAITTPPPVTPPPRY